ncbi:nuclease-related domain-containing protein [Sutcliffiella horikoshii]|uniref:NERD domain-containing protein n=1 Tax=Sutcliffiella horikoshii TaxID=79883 RepID=A0A5D4T8B1_9BACI|nr:nuclease-related domain-containing protein [Sutcliffiella horikoshii]TYS71485.1 NERD domain-containing protein [Sutcliffiella horikoshii]
MIKKQRTIPLRVQILRAMKRRIRPNHEKYEDLLMELGIKEAGIYGEQALDYYLKLLPETDTPYYILHDLRLPYRDTHFQIDTLILFSNFFLLLEVKYLRGTLYFDPKNNQLIQEVEDKPLKALQDPILQVSNQCSKLTSWLKQKNIPNAPCEKLVVLTNPKVIVKVLSSPSIVEKHVIKSPALSERVIPLDKKNPTHYYDKKTLNRISRLLIKEHTPLHSSPIKKYKVKPSDILTGVFCPHCSPLEVMERIHGKWKCPKCLLLSADAHIQTLTEYALLISTEITMSELKRFLRIDHTHVIRLILRKMKLPGSGNTKSRTYNLTPLLTKT